MSLPQHIPAARGPNIQSSLFYTRKDPSAKILSFCIPSKQQGTVKELLNASQKIFSTSTPLRAQLEPKQPKAQLQ